MKTLQDYLLSSPAFTDKEYLKDIVNFSVVNELNLKDQNTSNFDMQLMRGFQNRFNLTGLSLLQIIDPQPFQSGVLKGLKIHDYPTAFSLMRTLFEIYSNANWLIKRVCSQEEREFYFVTWNLHGYLDRQKIQKARGSIISDRANEQFKEEQMLIDQCRKEIKANKHFDTFSKKQQNILLNQKWSLVGIKQRAELTEFSKSQVDHIYKYISGYAHAEPLSLMQSSNNESPQQAKNMLFYPILYSCLIFTFQTRLFISQFPGLIQPKGDDIIEIAYYSLRDLLIRKEKIRQQSSNLI